jgi:DNA-binding MarR family transcriptional regulator
LKESASVRLLAEARGLSGEFDKLSQAVAERIGLSQTELLAMDLISRGEHVTAGHLARELNLTTGAITGLVDRLEKAGYARRHADPDDRRKVLVTATAREKRIRELYGPLGSSLRAAISGYSDAELDTLTDFLARLRSAVAGSADAMKRASRPA